MPVIEVALIGDGQLARGVAAVLASRSDVAILGPAGRVDAPALLARGSDVVIIATTTRLHDVTSTIEAAVLAGSNVIVSAEEAAFPWAVDAPTAERLDRLAISNGVTVLGAGLNPGFIFDALVLTLLGVCAAVRTISVERVVDLSGFGPAVRSRLGLGVSRECFLAGVTSGEILGHAGFPQSMSIVARAVGVTLERIDTLIEPVIVNDLTVGVTQDYTGYVDGRPWFRARFVGSLQPERPRDTITIDREAETELTLTIDPGVGSQSGSRAIIASSIDRVIAARPGWVTVAELAPAHPVVA